MRVAMTVAAGLALGLGLGVGANVSGMVLAGYGVAVGALIALASLTPREVPRARRGLRELWAASDLPPGVRRNARIKLTGSTLIVLLMLVALLAQLA